MLLPPYHIYLSYIYHVRRDTCAEKDVYDYLGLVFVLPAERNGKVQHKAVKDWDQRFVGVSSKLYAIIVLSLDLDL